jgi:p-hydroxybenzoate 3-monooxygenase
MRSPTISRLYLQCSPDDAIASWPDERIWGELHLRLAVDGWALSEGPIMEKGITLMRSSIVEPMRYANLFLAGDAAHIVPPTGAKGLNLAVADARVLATALIAWFRSGSSELLDSYSATCLRRVWRAEHFAWWMTSMLHRFDDDGAFEHRLHLAQLEYVVTSSAAATTLAENYVGFLEE